jgi:hypothetical protein
VRCTSVSYPLGKAEINWWAFTALATSSTASCDTEPPCDANKDIDTLQYGTKNTDDTLRMC